MQVKDIVAEIERFADPALKEDYDNVGLLVGSGSEKVSGVLITLDVTMDVLNEAIEKECNLIIAHHPLIFRGLKSITDRTETGRIVMKAIKKGIAIFAGHTNVDSVPEGVSGMMAKKLGLVNTAVLTPVKNRLRKLITYVPEQYAEKVRNAIFEAGAGVIGNYDSCSYNVSGTGTFRAGDNTDPFVGKKGELHLEPEVRIEVVMPEFITNRVVAAMHDVHPYEEVAYDIYSLENEWGGAGFGMAGELAEPMAEDDFLALLKSVFNVECLKHTALLNRPVKKVALCGGAGSELLKDAMRAGADVFVSGDFKYHQFFDAEKRILIADIGHFESEQFTKELFFEILTKKFSNFAIRLSEVNTNPIKYF